MMVEKSLCYTGPSMFPSLLTTSHTDIKPFQTIVNAELSGVTAAYPTENTSLAAVCSYGDAECFKIGDYDMYLRNTSTGVDARAIEFKLYLMNWILMVSEIEIRRFNVNED